VQASRSRVSAAGSASPSPRSGQAPAATRWGATRIALAETAAHLTAEPLPRHVTFACFDARTRECYLRMFEELLARGS